VFLGGKLEDANQMASEKRVEISHAQLKFLQMHPGTVNALKGRPVLFRVVMRYSIARTCALIVNGSTV
jgi:hypothetical protein